MKNIIEHRTMERMSIIWIGLVVSFVCLGYTSVSASEIQGTLTTSISGTSINTAHSSEIQGSLSSAVSGNSSEINGNLASSFSGTVTGGVSSGGSTGRVSNSSGGSGSVLNDFSQADTLLNNGVGGGYIGSDTYLSYDGTNPAFESGIGGEVAMADSGATGSPVPSNEDLTAAVGNTASRLGGWWILVITLIGIGLITSLAYALKTG